MGAIRRVAISTGGGDAPGLNAVIRAVVMAGAQRGWEIWGIRDGYNGLLDPQAYPEGGTVRLRVPDVSGIGHLGGTILGTTNHGNPLRFPRRTAEGGEVIEDRCDELVERFGAASFDALIAVGGDGSLEIAQALAQRGVRVVGVPKTIDNDLERTAITFGFDSAVSFATECLDRLHTTAASHRRIMVVEVMGRYAGWIALHAGIAGNAHVILIPEIPYDLEVVSELVRARVARGKHATLVVVAEGARPIGGDVSYQEEHRLGGIGGRIAEELEARAGKESRCVVLGHLLRGGPPTSFDRLVALRFGAAAIRAVEDGRSAVMVALHPPEVRYEPLAGVVRRMKRVSIDGDTVRTARDIGISFGDRVG